MPLESFLLVFDLALRGGNCLLLALICGLLLRDHPDRLEARIGAVLAIGVAGFAVWSGPDLGVRGRAVMIPVLVFSVGNGLVFWLFTRAMFEDYFRLRPWHFVAWVAIALVGLQARHSALAGDVVIASALARGLSAQTLAFVALAGLQAVGSWDSDLLETRRRLRVMIVPAAIAYAALSLTTEAIDSLLDRGLLASLVSAVVLALLTFTAAWAMLTVSGSKELFAQPQSTLISQADQELLDHLSQTIRFERLYRQQDLTIGHLAVMFEVSETHLSRLIHMGLGYRSHGCFLDSYRVAEVKSALDDPHQDDTARLTIARDAGFRSLGQLGLAFRAVTGVTIQSYQATREARSAETA